MDYAALITYVFVMCITPGPNNVMVTTSGANFGFRATMPHIFGIVAGTALQVAMCCLGLGAVFAQVQILHKILSWVGLAYMIYLSWKILGASLSKDGEIGKPLSFLQGMSFQFVNPKAWIIIITVATVFMPKTGELIIPTIIMVMINMVLCIISVSIWTAFGYILRGYLKNPANMRIFNIIMAALLLGTAIMIVIKQI